MDKSLADSMKEKKKGGENKKRGGGGSAAGAGKKRGGAGQSGNNAKKQKTQQAKQGGDAAKKTYVKIAGTRLQQVKGGDFLRVAIQSGKTFQPNDIQGVQQHLAKTGG
jgi:hypothetical protein